MDDSIIVVSGLPRSGTSMMMRMLEWGGLETVTDKLRAPDDSNPLGYYEDERVRGLREGEHQWLGSTAGKVVKVVSPLLEHLPRRHPYQVIFMLRDIDEILASQARMLSRNGQDTGHASDETLAPLYQAHLRSVESWLAEQSNLDLIYMGYRDVIEDAEGSAIRIRRFLRMPLDQDAMVRAVDRTLYRERHERP